MFEVPLWDKATAYLFRMFTDLTLMPYELIALLSVSVLAFVHIVAPLTTRLERLKHGRFLSAGGGVAIAYVFIDLLPKLCQHDTVLHKALATIFPYFERHVYVLALLGFLLFFAVDRAQDVLSPKSMFRFSIASYIFFNFLVGYAITDQNNPEIRPLFLFTFAIALHYFVNDYTLNEKYPIDYDRYGRWMIVASLYLGWLVGTYLVLSKAAIAVVSAFIAGGVIMNVTRHELPKNNPHSLGAFLWAAAFYTVVLLTIGA